jgi:hypothetical protein
MLQPASLTLLFTLHFQQIRGLRMVTVASDFLSMLNGKWSSEKLQDEQFKDKLE